MDILFFNGYIIFQRISRLNISKNKIPSNIKIDFFIRNMVFNQYKNNII